MGGQSARRAELLLVYEGADISQDIAPFLISFSYTDNASDKADDISITLEDREGRWRDPWFPSKGAVIKATIISHDWAGPDKMESLPCGTFEIDQIECSGPPTQVSIKGVSTLVSKPMRQERRTKTWENVKLSVIAGDVAQRSGLELFWDSPNDPLYERRDQTEQSDLAFLMGLCRTYGIGIKVTDTQLVCYDEELYEAQSPVGTLSFSDKHLKNYRFQTKTQDTYKGAHLQYHDPVKDEDYDVYEDGDAEGTGRILELNQKADSIDDARKIAGKKLRECNKRELTGSVTLVGDMRFLGGNNVAILGWGKFDGKYVIEKATHAIGVGGYTTTLDLRMGGTSKAARKKSGGELVYTGNEVYGKPDNTVEVAPNAGGTF